MIKSIKTTLQSIFPSLPLGGVGGGLGCLLLFLLSTLSSCSSDSLGDSILDTTTPAVDKSKATYQFDQWLYDNFVTPYNVEIQYQFQQVSSDFEYNLSPADYNRSQLLSHFMRYLFYDVYSKHAPEKETFMKQYGPRIFHFIGSVGYSQLTGAETLGTAAGGVKVTLYCVNDMKPYSKGVQYNASDVELLNERFFHTMHHEFSHILHQTKSYPVAFGQVTSSTYSPREWTERDTTTSARLGYVTNYASNQNKEDFVETLSCVITDNQWRWMNRIIAASCNGLRTTDDADDIRRLIANMKIDSSNPSFHWNNFTIYKESEYDEESDSYKATGNLVLDIYRNYQYVYSDKRGNYVYKYSFSDPVHYSSFEEFLNALPVSATEKMDGIHAILKKIDIASKWYKEKWGLDLYQIRDEVQQRQNNINEYIKGIEIY